MIYYYLQEGYDVHAYYAEIANNVLKTKQELTAIERMLPFLTRFKFKWHGKIVTAEMLLFEQNLPLKQVPIWLLAATWMPSPVAIGYVMNDCAISYLVELHGVAKAVSKLRREPLHLLFPMIKCLKIDLWRDLPEELRKNVVWCEMPIKNLDDEHFTSCNECSACERMNREILKENSTEDATKITADTPIIKKDLPDSTPSYCKDPSDPAF